VFRVQHADSGEDFVGSQHRDSFPSKKGVRGERAIGRDGGAFGSGSH
jgi:hypothetical protein